MADNAEPGSLNWRLSAHPITLLTYLGFRIGMPTSRKHLPDRPKLIYTPGSLLMYLFGVLFIKNFVLVFIFTLLLLSLDFYYLKNIAGRRLVGLRWWNEVNTTTGDSHWVFESRETSAPSASGGMGGGAEQNKTDKRFFWMAIYVVPALWVGLADSGGYKIAEGYMVGYCWYASSLPLPACRFAIEREDNWLTRTSKVIALILTITNATAFSRCDKFGQASSFAGSAFSGGNFARGLAGNMVGRLFR